MKPIADDLYKKIVKVSANVRADFRRRGIIIPVENKNGSISLDNFTISRNNDGFYVIINRRGDEVVSNINLPQTAAVVANGLALGQFLDDKLLKADREYGYALFDEALHERAVKRSKNKPLDYFDLMLSKCMIARAKKEQHKSEIVKSFEKLRKLV
jgi:hypothetical protein